MRGIRTVLVVLLLAIVGVVVGATPANADTNDFRFSSYGVVYELGRDAEGHSTLTTTETFVAVFPDTDQNRGMQRAIPTRYEGHPTDLDLVSVTDAGGAPRPVETETDDGFLVVTSAGDDYVHGEQSYVFTYTQRNVTLSADVTESGQDEFYWDTNGLGWQQPFDRYSITVNVDPGLVQTGALACYRGVEGSDQSCEIEPGVTATGTDLGRSRTSRSPSASSRALSWRGTAPISAPSSASCNCSPSSSRSGRWSRPSCSGPPDCAMRAVAAR